MKPMGGDDNIAGIGAGFPDARQAKVFDPAVWWSVRSSCCEDCTIGRVLHGSAATTEAVRRALQLRLESVRALARRYGISPTTIQKWRQRSTMADARPRWSDDRRPLRGMDRWRCHRWTDGQVEGMNRTLKDATVKRYHHQSHNQRRTHLQLFVDACNHARRL